MAKPKIKIVPEKIDLMNKAKRRREINKKENWMQKAVAILNAKKMQLSINQIV